MEKKSNVTITTFLNPNAFWLLFEKDKEDLNKLEVNLSKLDLKEVIPDLKEVVLISDKKKYKRALVKEKNRESYICWLLDYGENFVTKKVYEIPEEFRKSPGLAQPACLFGIVPLQNILNVETSKCIDKKDIYFTEGTIKFTSDYLNKADVIKFELGSLINYVLSGTLHLRIKGEFVNLNEKLVKEKLADVDNDLFLKVMDVNFPTIHQNSVRIRNTSYELAVSEGVGRGCSRSRNEVQSPTKSDYVEKWLVQNKMKEENIPVRQPAEASVVTENLTTKSINSESSPKNTLTSPRSLKSASGCENRLKPSALRQIFKENTNKHQVEEKDDASSTKSGESASKPKETESKNRLTPSMLKSLSINSISPKSKSCNNNEIEKENRGAIPKFDKKDIQSLLKGRGKRKHFVSNTKVGNASTENDNADDSNSWSSVDVDSSGTF